MIHYIVSFIIFAIGVAIVYNAFFWSAYLILIAIEYIKSLIKTLIAR